jgi:hypothetical protein
LWDASQHPQNWDSEPGNWDCNCNGLCSRLQSCCGRAAYNVRTIRRFMELHSVDRSRAVPSDIRQHPTPPRPLLASARSVPFVQIIYPRINHIHLPGCSLAAGSLDPDVAGRSDYTETDPTQPIEKAATAIAPPQKGRLIAPLPPKLPSARLRASLANAGRQL